MFIELDCGKTIQYNDVIKIEDIINEYYLEKKDRIILVRMNKRYLELSKEICESGYFEIVDVGSYVGFKTYERTMHFILYVACKEVFPNCSINISHATGGNIYGEIEKTNNEKLVQQDIDKIKIKINEIIQEDDHIERLYASKEEAIEIFHRENMSDKVRLLKYLDKNVVCLYKLKGYYNYFYGQMGNTTGVVKKFDLILSEGGFILRYCKKNDLNVIGEYKELTKLNAIFKETKEWIRILGVRDVGQLNDIIQANNIIEIIRVSEALHEKKLANIADKIKSREKCKIIFIAGPSSSGKTTFAKRLSIQLRVNGLKPFPISLDDYFINRDLVPLQEDGKPDFEDVSNVDIKQFSYDIKKILSGDEVQIPEYNFVTGKREYNGYYIKIPSNGVLVIEGIHGLNPILIDCIGCELENIFKIYISALTQLNLDNQNRISTTDVRMIRRIVRDNLSRGVSASKTLEMVESIKRGEEKHIFAFQEEADVMFNSTLVYELSVLKDVALNELEKIDKDSDVYYDASRLKKFLKFFKSIDPRDVADNSILREFIGGSCFYKY